MPMFVSVLIWMFYLIIFIRLLVNAIFPRYIWKTFESWKANSEPTEAYFKMKRISSIVGLIIMSIVMAGPTVMYLLDK